MENTEFFIPVTCAVTGGAYGEMLKEAITIHSAERLALLIEPISIDFALPSKSGMGTKTKINRNRRAFYSRELEINYYAYIKDAVAHFVLFDSTQSIKRKIMLAEGLGIERIIVSRQTIKEYGIDIGAVFTVNPP